jgi:Na+/proline symporter
MRPLFNVIFRMVYLGQWVHRSNVLTGAEWMYPRFDRGRGAELAYASVVIYALVSVIGFLTMAFQGIGKFAEPFFQLGWSPNTYALVIMLVSGVYCIFGGMFSVVLNDVIQFGLILVAAVIIAVVAMANSSPEQIAAAVPAGWDQLFFAWRLDLDWSQTLPALQDCIYGESGDGYAVFGFFMLMLFLKGVLVSMAGPTPNYAIQHVLSTRSPREAALKNMMMALASIAPRFLLIAGIAFGYTSVNVHSVTRWIVSALVPAFVIPNVLKCRWWRFNGHGFWAGMAGGTVAALIIPAVCPALRDVWLFLTVLGASGVAALAACLATKPEPDAVLMEFYRTVRPWGWWRPILEKCRAETPALAPNRDALRDGYSHCSEQARTLFAVPYYPKSVLTKYGRTPVKPVLDGAPGYENIPRGSQVANGRREAIHARRFCFWALFSGALGHTYGCNGVWQMWAPDRQPLIGAEQPWHEAIQLPGAGQMRHVRTLIESGRRQRTSRASSPQGLGSAR